MATSIATEIESEADFAFYPPQIDFLTAVETFRGFVGGRGTGKSHVGAYDLLSRARDGRLYMVVAPTYPMMRDSSMRTFVAIAREMGQLIDIRGTAPMADIRTQDGGTAEVLFRTATEPDSLRGPNLSGVWLDEASLMAHEAFIVAIACLREGGEMGWLSLTFTPRGKKHWTYSLFFDEHGEEKPRTCLVHARTIDNPFLSDEFYEEIRAQYTSDVAQQELEGRFVELGGLIFRREWFDVVDRVPERAERVRYWDKAATQDGGDYSAGVLMAQYDGMFYVEDVVRGQWSFGDRDRIMLQTARLDKARHKFIQVVTVVEQEPGSGGKESALLTMKRMAGYNVRLDKVTGVQHRIKDHLRLPGDGKIVRAMPLAAQAEVGNVCIVAGTWNQDWLDEITGFPQAVFDDQVDATSGAFNQLAMCMVTASDAVPTLGRATRRTRLGLGALDRGGPGWRR